MPERFEIYVVYKRRYINTLPFLFFPFSALYNHHCYDTGGYVAGVIISGLYKRHSTTPQGYLPEQAEEKGLMENG